MKNGWPRKKISEIAKDSLGKMLDKTKNRGEPKPYLRNLNVRWFDFNLSDVLEMRFLPEEEAKFTAVKGDVLICKGGCPGRAAIWQKDEPIHFLKALHRVRFHEPERSKWFLYYLLSKDLDGTLKNHFNGAGIQHFTGESLAQFEMPVPPLAEQRRIVGILDEAFEGIATAKAHAEKNLQNARALFESHLQSVFTQRGEGWVETQLGDIGKVSMCKRVFKNETTAAGEIPFYKIGTFGKEADAFIPLRLYDEYKRKFSFPKKGDVLISAAGTIGRCVRYDGEPAYFQDSNIVWIDNDESQVLNEYLYHFYGACDWNSTNGATISRLYNENLRQVVTAFPKSLEAQSSHVRTLDAMVHETQRLESIYQRKLAALDDLKKSLLHQAFSGELTGSAVSQEVAG